MYEYIQNVCIMGLQLPDNFLEGLILISWMKQIQTLPTSTINHQFYHYRVASKLLFWHFR